MQIKKIGLCAHQLSALMLSFLDDVVLLVLSRMGFHSVWLRWLSAVVLIATLSYWIFRLLRYCYHQQVF